LGSTSVFSRALSDVVEDEVLETATDDQVTSTQITAMQLVHRLAARTPGELAELLGVSNAAGTKLVDRLVARGLAVRRQAITDRREMELSLTPRGREMLSRYDARKNRVLAKTLGQFPPEELRRISDLLDRLSATILNHSSKPGHTCLQCYLHPHHRCIAHASASGGCKLLKRAQGR
jgi:DNA-binding MarR family transcriptional regulator